MQDSPDSAEECDFFGVTPAFAGGIESTAARASSLGRQVLFPLFSHREKQVISKLPPNFDIEIFVIDKCFFVHYNKD